VVVFKVQEMGGALEQITTEALEEVAGLLLGY